MSFIIYVLATMADEWTTSLEYLDGSQVAGVKLE